MNVRDDRGDVRTTVRAAAIDDENSDRLVELANAVDTPIELQLSMKCSLKEPVLDFVVGEVGSLGGAAHTDISVVSACDPPSEEANASEADGLPSARACKAKGHGRHRRCRVN